MFPLYNGNRQTRRFFKFITSIAKLLMLFVYLIIWKTLTVHHVLSYLHVKKQKKIGNQKV